MIGVVVDDTDLKIAAEKGNEDIVKTLLLAGADPNYMDRYLRTPLHYAVRNNHAGVVQVLLNDSRCDPNAKEKTDSNLSSGLSGHWIKGITALHTAVVKGYDDCVKMLLDAGADVNCQDDDGRTPLYYAAENNNVDIVQMLLNNSLCDPSNKALTIAAEKGNEDIVKTLLHAGADPNYMDGYLRTLLHYAVRNNHAGVVQVLLNDSRCDPNVKQKTDSNLSSRPSRSWNKETHAEEHGEQQLKLIPITSDAMDIPL
nr:26S proteasome non-ATPase regulatory subunit 10-like [Cherax quadricarinatus]